MGEALYAQLGHDHPDLACRIYAPVGSHRDLLAYLVRRLLENGANSSFVALAADDNMPVATLLRRPADIIGTADSARHPNIPLPRDLYRPQRINSRGIEFGDRAALDAPASRRWPASRLTTSRRRRRRPRKPPADARQLRPAADFTSRGAGHRPTRAAMLESAADLLEQRARAFHRAVAVRGRQDAGRCALGSARGGRFLPLLRRARPHAVRRRRDDAGPDRREQCAAVARPRRVRRDLAVEFPARDLHWARSPRR